MSEVEAVPAPGLRQDRAAGSSSLVIVWLGSVVALLAMVLVALGAVAVARQRAAVASDLGALAGAARSLEGPVAACAAATSIVVAQGGRVASCTLTGDVCELVVELRPAGVLARFGTARGRSRAGPARLVPT